MLSPARRLSCLSVLLLSAGTLACGDGAGSESSGGEEATSITTTLTSSTTDSTTAETGSESDSNSQGTTDSDSQSTTDSDSQSTTDTQSTTDSDSDTQDSNTSASSGSTNFDLAPVPDAGEGDCGMLGGGDGEKSFIWVANSSENTISKINTKTLVEEGRYRTRDSGGSPSRTSVNLAGDVAVANRSGGVTKVLAVTESCDEMTNGMPGLQTSTGGNDILAWGTDDCVQWYTPIAYTANRPAAWTAGILDQGSCTLIDAKVWTAASNGSGANAHAMRLNGDTGVIEDDVLLAGFTVNGFGPYGGAVDPQENFWTIGHSSGNLARVDAETLEVSTWTAPNMSAYGFTIDEYGRPWMAGLSGTTAVFDPETEQFTTLQGGGLGMGQAANGIMWQATHPSQTGIRGWDIDTLEIVKEIVIPGVNSSRGVSVDIDGYVWFVEVGNDAYKIDADAETWENFPNLVGAYTYSDMTGNALSLVAGGIAG